MSKEKITAAFRDLRKIGYFAKQNFTCCQTCGWYEVPDEKSDRAVFYHSQDNEDLKENGECHISWSGNGEEITSVMHKHGIKTEWDGSDSKRIKIRI